MKNYTITNCLYSQCDLPKNMFLKLKQIINCKENTKIPYNSKLAGHICDQHQIIKLDDDFIEFLKKNAIDFLRENHNIQKNQKVKLKLDSLWVNKQKKYEFNPLHNHNGLVSFVCWVQIPYDLNDELNLDNCKLTRIPFNSLFVFHHIDYTGRICTERVMIDKTYEGKCIFFDSSTNHQVYPFYTSDDYRISVAGNFIIDEDRSPKIFYN